MSHTIAKTVACAWQFLVEMHQEYKKYEYMCVRVHGWNENKIPKLTHINLYTHFTKTKHVKGKIFRNKHCL